MVLHPYRSVLYMPASNERALKKATTLMVDAVILDLEDAVAPEEKEIARKNAVQALVSYDYGMRQRVVRINDWFSQWAQDDLQAFISSPPDAFLIPKLSHPELVKKIMDCIDGLGFPKNVKIWAMIETPLSLINLTPIVQLTSLPENRLTTLVLGTNDLAKETGMDFGNNREPLLPWLSQLVMAARAFRLNLLDGVFNDIHDMEGFQKECEEGKKYGFNGKTLIHPNQIDLPNKIFAPSPDEIRNAQEIVDLFSQPENSKKNVLSHNGRMVERLHKDIAEQILLLHQIIKKNEREKSF